MPSSFQGTTHLWLRAESKIGERRSPLTPDDATSLIEAGFQLFVERSAQRIFEDGEYARAGCILEPEGGWPKAPVDAVILGLKELPQGDTPLDHTHVYFAHAYKEQRGWQELLGRFQRGGGLILDLEYLTDANERRVAAFGYWAGYVGAALGIARWVELPHPAGAIEHSYDTAQDLLEEIADKLRDRARKPRVLIIGAHGRAGSGAMDLALALKCSAEGWDVKHTSHPGPYSEALDFDILINCVLVTTPVPPFITTELLQQERQLSVVVDVSCDPQSPTNPLPFYSTATTLSKPALRVVKDPPLDLIAIDHLPSLLPKESSESFSRDLLPHLLDLRRGSSVWQNAEQRFREAVALLE